MVSAADADRRRSTGRSNGHPGAGVVHRRLGDALGAGGAARPARRQHEAALTQGFTPGQTLRLILLPQALRNVQPSLVGIFIGLLKDTSLAFIVNVPELTTVAGQVNNRVQIYPLAIFVFTGAVYYLLCCALSQLANRRFTRRSADRRFAAD